MSSPIAVMEQCAREDYRDYLGAVLRVRRVMFWRGEDSEEFAVRSGPGVLVRVTATSDSSLLAWNGEWLDPRWDVEVIDYLPELQGGRFFCIHGVRSFELVTSEEWRVEENACLAEQDPGSRPEFVDDPTLSPFEI